jgi:hypothetical protein
VTALTVKAWDVRLAQETTISLIDQGMELLLP